MASKSAVDGSVFVVYQGARTMVLDVSRAGNRAWQLANLVDSAGPCSVMYGLDGPVRYPACRAERRQCALRCHARLRAA